MAFAIRTREARAGDKSGTVYELVDESGSARAEVWPFFGFNCLKWQVRTHAGWGDVLYHAPDWESNPVPTRSGHPILFPFPNRMKDGKFTFRGKDYQLPLNESSGKHAIHGFTPRAEWTVISTDADDVSASIVGTFRVENHWPGILELSITYTLTAHTLRVDASIVNCDSKPVPCGLGFHPYFCIPTAPGAKADDMTLEAAGAKLWLAVDGIPTGEPTAVPAELDFRQRRPVGNLVLDRLYADLNFGRDEMNNVACLKHVAAPGQLTVSVTPSYRELLLFTPQHRGAVAIEPYTCASDAANLDARGIDSGWVVLPPGAIWNSAVEYRWES